MSKRRVRLTGDSKADPHTAQQAANFLFDLGKAGENKVTRFFNSALLSAKTRIKGPKTMSAISYYDVLAQGFGSEAALVVGDSLKRLLIADQGEGRKEATSVVKGDLPDEIEIAVGHDRTR